MLVTQQHIKTSLVLMCSGPVLSLQWAHKKVGDKDIQLPILESMFAKASRPMAWGSPSW